MYFWMLFLNLMYLFLLMYMILLIINQLMYKIYIKPNYMNKSVKNSVKLNYLW